MILLVSFIDYLKCIDPSPAPKFTNAAIFYSSLKTIPLNKSALASGKIISLTPNNLLQQKNKHWETLQTNSIHDIVATSINYLEYLSEKTITYKALPLNQLPYKNVKSRTMLSGTLNPTKTKVVDIVFLLAKAGIKSVPRSNNLNNNNLLVMTLSDVNNLINIIPASDYQNKLLFIVLKFFGIRAGEAADLQVDTHNLSKNFLFLDDQQAIKDLKNNLSGGIEYNDILGTWICHISTPSTDRYDMQAKTGARSIPLNFSTTEFESALVYGLKERLILMGDLKQKDKHDYLFVSKKTNTKGHHISGSTINRRFTTFSCKLYNAKHIDLRIYSPHSIRHFFATYLIREKGHYLSDVSKWLGHSSIEMTRNTYFYYLPSQTRNTNISNDICNTFRKEYNKSNE